MLARNRGFWLSLLNPWNFQVIHRCLIIFYCSCVTLARVNENRPASMCRAVFLKLMSRCRQFAPGHRLKFKNRLYPLDAITLNLCLYLLLAFLKLKVKINLSMQQMLRLLQLNLFERRDLAALLEPPESQFVECGQFSLF